MPFGPLDDDDERRLPPPAPDDRLWRHPSEMAATPVQSAVAAAPERGWSLRRYTATVSVAAGATGALVTVLVLLMTGVLDHTEAIIDTDRKPVSAAISGPLNRIGPVHMLPQGLVAVTVATQGEQDGAVRTLTGVVIDDDGHAIVADPMVALMRPMEAAGPGGRTDRVSLAAADPTTGLAVLSLGRTDFTPVAAPESMPVAGSPTGVVKAVRSELTEPGDLWISRGTINAVDLTVSSDGLAVAGLLQTDAPRPATPSAVLTDGAERVVGLLIAADDDPGDAFGYALPLRTALSAARDLLESGRVRRPWIGIAGRSETEGTLSGIRLVDVAQGSPAETAGLRNNDLVVSVGGQAVSTIDALAGALSRAEVGRAVRITVVRGGERKPVTVVPGERPAGVSGPSGLFG